MKTATAETISENIFGGVVYSYTRAQAIEDGVLVDMSQAVTPCPFKYPVAMSRAAYEATIAAGGRWVANTEGSEDLELPGGQDPTGRFHDVCSVLLHAIRRATGPTDHIWFRVLVDVHGNGQRRAVELYSVCGPGDDGAPVITIMLRGED